MAALSKMKSLVCPKSKEMIVEMGRGLEREYYFIPLFEGHVTNRMEGD